jgi:hypothetical protein
MGRHKDYICGKCKAWSKEISLNSCLLGNQQTRNRYGTIVPWKRCQYPKTLSALQYHQELKELREN